jgi:hypothetical protein
MTNYYLKRGDKAIGPLPFERLEALYQVGKLQESTSVAVSPKGPWMPFSQLQTEMSSGAIESSGGNAATNGDGLFSGGFPMDGIPQIAPPVAASQYWTPPQSASTATSRRRTTDPSDFEEEEAPFLVRCFAPWAGENSLARYGNLDRYAKIMKFVTRLLFVLGIVVVVIAFLSSTTTGIYAFVTGLDTNGEEIDRIYVFLGMLGVYTILSIQFLLLHLFYIVSMAICDFFRLAMDVEANTRRSR